MTIDTEKALVIFPDEKSVERWQNALYEIGFRTVYMALSTDQALLLIQHWGADESAVVLADGDLLSKQEAYAQAVLAEIYDMPQALFMLMSGQPEKTYPVQQHVVAHREKLRHADLPVAQ